MSDDSTLFEWDSGLVDDVDFTVQAATFTYNSKMGEDLVLKLTGTYADEDGTVVEYDHFIKCGSGWEPIEGGKRARREDGRDKLFNARSGIVQFIAAAAEAGVSKQMIVDGGGPTSTKWLEGLTLHMEQKQFDGVINGEKATWFKLLPTKLVGKGGGEKKAAPAPKATPAPESSDEGVSAGLIAKLKKLAKESASHDEFVDAAFSKYESEVAGNAAAEAIVLDETLYTEAQ